MGAISGTIYVVGGYGSGYANVLGTVEAYDTATNTWTTKASLPVPTRRINGSAAVIGGTIYVMGGIPWYGGSSATLWAYDPATDTWTAKSPMPTARCGLVAVAVGRLIYAIGGASGLYVSKLEVYDPITDSWTAKTPMPTARVAHGAGCLDGSIFVMGGGVTGPALTSTVESYDVATNAWTTRASMPIALADMGATLAGGLMYSVGGEGPGGVYHSEVYAYDPFNDTWVSKAPMPTVRDELGVVAIGATLYAIGGGATCNGCAAYNVVEAGVLPPGAMSATLAVSPAVQHIGRWVTVTLTVGNPGGFVLASLTPSLGICAGAGLVSLISGPVPSSTAFLPPEWTQTFVWTFSVSGIGTAVFTATVTGYDLASCATLLVSSSATVMLESRIEEPPPPLNPLILTTPGAALDHNVISTAHGEVVLARIAPRDSSAVTVRVYTASGRLVRTLRRLTPMESGQWLASWDGKTEDEMPVSRGVYLIRVTGGGLDERLKLIVR